MSDTLNVALIGHSSSRLNELENALQDDPAFDLSRKLLLDGVLDPFEDLPVTSNVVVLDLGERWREVLNAVSNRSRRSRAPMILVGPEGNTEMMRLALKAGARDFQTHPISPDELATAVRQVGNEKPETGGESTAELCVFLSAKGGAGASALATSVACALHQRSDAPSVLLMDLELQYGNLPLYLDQSSNTRLTQALVANERVDDTLLEACLIRTGAGVDVLASRSDQVFSTWDIPQQSVSNLLNLVSGRYRHVVVDVPRQIDPVTFQAVEQASHICVVMQQTLADLRYARQVIALLRDQGVSNERFRIVVNRYDKNGAMRVTDVDDAFDGIDVSSVPNDFKRMAYATDNAVPLTTKYRGTPLSKSVVALADTLYPPPEKVRRGLFGLRRLTSA